MARETLATPFSKDADLTRPKETMSRLNPGYFTFLSCPMMSSVVTSR
jgi:hypothetical protein